MALTTRFHQICKSVLGFPKRFIQLKIGKIQKQRSKPSSFIGCRTITSDGSDFLFSKIQISYEMK